MVISKRLTAEEIERMKAFPNENIDDCPEMTDEELSNLKFKNSPQQVEFKIMLDKDVYEALLLSNENIQIFANRVLRQAVLTA